MWGLLTADNLFLVLYEDLRVYTIWRAEISHFQLQHMSYRKTGTEVSGARGAGECGVGCSVQPGETGRILPACMKHQVALAPHLAALGAELVR